MTDTPPTKTENRSDPIRPAWRRVTQRVARLSVIALLLWVGWTTARGISALFAPPETVTVSNPPTVEAVPSLPQLVYALPKDGYWTFGEVRWQVGVSQVNARIMQQRFDELLSAEVERAAHSGSQRFLQAFKRLPTQILTKGDRTRYQVQGQRYQWCVVSEKDEDNRKEWLVGVAMAFAGKNNRWNLFEFRQPRRRVRNSTRQTDRHLLPLPQNAQRVSCRRSRSGEILLEFIDLPAMSDDLLSRWTAAGWKLRKTMIGSSPAFSYLCRKGNRTVYAWSVPTTGEGRTLILVRSDGT